jgi:tyrosinase
MDRYVSPELRAPASPGEGRYDRVDLEMHGVDHSGRSFAVRVFVDDPDADAETPTSGNARYGGSFYVFGHGPCLGDEGHCDVPAGPVSPYDFGEPHPLAPKFRRLEITSTLRAIAAESAAFTITLVPVTNKGGRYESDDLLIFTRLSVVAYS